jgi:hypothetical protein
MFYTFNTLVFSQLNYLGKDERVTLEIGIIKTLIGAAVATAADGSHRSLQMGDGICHGEVITTSTAGAVEVKFNDDSVMILGRSTQAIIDNNVFDPVMMDHNCEELVAI